MKLIAAAALAAWMMVCGSGSVAGAEKPLTGEDAAYMDWAVKNCAAKSTDMARSLVEQASAKGRDTFTRAYTKLFDSKLATALDTPDRQKTTCSEIKGWYGPEGTRITGLIKFDGTGSSGATSPDKPAGPAGAGGGKKGGFKR